MIHAILTNPTYTGDLAQGRSRVKSYMVHQIKTVPKEEWMQMVGTYEAIIDYETFDKVQGLFPAAVIVFFINESAYCAETIRAALEAVPAGQMEAGYCAGMSYLQIIWRIVLTLFGGGRRPRSSTPS